MMAIALTGGAMAQSFSGIMLDQNIAVREGLTGETTVSAAAINATDTLDVASFGTTGQVLFDQGGSGFIFGTSAVDTFVINPQNQQQIDFKLITDEVAAAWLAQSSYNVIGAMMFFGYKVAVNPSPADLQVHLYKMASNAAVLSVVNNQPVMGDGPGATPMASATLPFADIAAQPPVITRTFAFFQNPVWVNYDFALSVDLTALYGTGIDTVVLYTQPINGGGSSTGEYTYRHSGSDNSMIQVTSPWIAGSAIGATVDVAIFAIVAESGTGIEEQGFLNGVKMTTYPNPSLASDNVTIQYGLETAAERVDVNIFDMNGKQVYTAAQGAKASGLYRLNVPAGTLSAGSYIYAIDADGRRMAKRMEVLK